MFPQIPEDFEALSATELRSLANEIRDAIKALKERGDVTQEEVSLALDAKEARESLLALADEKDQADADRADFDAIDTDETEEDADETELSEETEEEETEETELSEDSDTDETEDEVEASVTKVRTSTGVTSTASEDPDLQGFRPDKLLAYGGTSDREGGSLYESWSELVDDMIAAASNLSPGSAQKLPIAKVVGNYGPEARLSERMTQNLRTFDGMKEQPELMAALCAPSTPIYDMACWNTTRRPVFGSLPKFMPDARGSVSIFPSPSLSDVTDQSPAGVGVWDSDDDDTIGTTDPSSKACAVISCGTPTVYELYGVWRCLTIQNLLAMTFPELVEAWLNRLAAWHSRVAEVQLLEAMGSAATAVDAPDLGYGSTVSVTSAILTLLGLHQEQERWDNGPMDAWLPRWVLYAMKTDIIRRRRTDGNIDVPSDGRIAQMFRDVGVEPHFFIDPTTWSPAAGDVETGGDLNSLPDSLSMVIAPRGKFAVMDRGQLNIGVAGNNIYRDNASNASNNFTMFFENFEGLVDTDSCPAYLLTVDNLCHNGVQIDDAVLDCDGAVPAT